MGTTPKQRRAQVRGKKKQLVVKPFARCMKIGNAEWSYHISGSLVTVRSPEGKTTKVRRLGFKAGTFPELGCILPSDIKAFIQNGLSQPFPPPAVGRSDEEE